MTGLFNSQNGLATRMQLIGLGVPPSTIAHRTRAGGSWSAVLRGVCADRGQWPGTATETERVRAALLYAGPEAMVSGFAALRLYGIRCAPRAPHGPDRTSAAVPAMPSVNGVKVLIPGARRRASAGFVVVARTRRLPEPVRIDGFRVAPVVRAAVDACLDTRDAERVRAIVSALIRSGDCTAGELRTELEAHQMWRSAVLRAVLREHAEEVDVGTEKRCLSRLVDAQAPPALWNRSIVEQSTGRVAVLPGALWPEHGIVLDVDAEPDDAARERAATRRRWMSHVLRLTVAQVTPSQLHDRWDEVWAELRGLLNRPPTYRLPPGYVLA